MRHAGKKIPAICGCRSSNSQLRDPVPDPSKSTLAPVPAQPRRRRFLLAALACSAALVAIALGRPVWHIVSTAWRDADEVEKIPPGFTDDASRMNLTRVADVVPVETEPAAAERQLAELLAGARAAGLHVSIAGTRHSMGGHTISPGGIVIDMLPFNRMEL